MARPHCDTPLVFTGEMSHKNEIKNKKLKYEVILEGFNHQN
jgi:hypothetical protein